LAPPCSGPRSAPIAPVIVQDQRDVERAAVQLARRLAVEHLEEMAGEGRLVAARVDADPAAMELVPVHQHGREARQQPLGDAVLLHRRVGFRLDAADERAGRAQDVHRVRGGRQHLERALQRLRKCAVGGDAAPEPFEFLPPRQFAVEQHVRDLGVRGEFRQLSDVVAAVVQPLALASDRADGGAAGDDAGEDDALLPFSSSSSSHGRLRSSGRGRGRREAAGRRPRA
jgi:hypothetical protein